MTSTDHTFSTLTATSVRSIHLMANGSLADLAEVIHPLAHNREAIDEPPADARDKVRPRSTPAHCGYATRSATSRGRSTTRPQKEISSSSMRP